MNLNLCINSNNFFSYRLLLGNFFWNIIYLDSSKDWVYKLQKIMNLDTTIQMDYPIIIVSRIYREPIKLKNFINHICYERQNSQNEWYIYKFNQVSFLLNEKLSISIFELNEENDHINEIIKMQYFFFPIYKFIIDQGSLPIHAGLIEKNSKGFLIGAPGGTGKSTCCSRIPYPWIALADDLSVLILNQQKKFQAHPFPTWGNCINKQNKNTWDIKKHIPLHAIFFLEQSDVDEIKPVTAKEAALKLTYLSSNICNIYWKYMKKEEVSEWKEKLFINSWTLASKIPCYILRASLHGEFWKEIEKVV